MARKKAPPGSLQKRPLCRPFIAEWREHRGLSQERLADRVGELLGASFSVSTLSRIENAKSPFNQRQLEALAEALCTDTASLLMRDPSQPDAIWTIWDQAKPAEKIQIVEVAKALIGANRKTGTDP